MTQGSRLDRAWPSLVALVGTVAVVLALLWVFGGDVDRAPADDDLVEVAPDDSDEADGDDGDDAETDLAEPAPDPVTAPPEMRRLIGVVNATDLPGLAAAAKERFEAGGWTVPAIASTDREFEASTICYPPGMAESAEALRAQFPEITRLEPTCPGMAQDRLVVVLADDYAVAVGDTEAGSDTGAAGGTG